MVVCRRIPMAIDQPNRARLQLCRNDNVPAFTWSSDRPKIVEVVAANWSFQMTVEALTDGMYDETLEASGSVTVAPHLDDADWIVVSLDGVYAEAYLTMRRQDIVYFLADVAHAVFLGEPDRCREVEHDWALKPLRRDGAA